MKHRRTGIITGLLLTLLIAYALVSMIRMNSRIVEARRTRDDLSAAVRELEAENAALAYEIEHSEDPVVLEKVAREKLGLVLPGEVIFYDLSK